MNHFQTIINMYHSAPINDLFKPELTINESGKSIINVDINTKHFHSAGFLHGSTIFKLLDDSAFFAAQSTEHECFIVTVSFNSHFIRPVKSGQLIGYGTVIETTKNQIIAESRIENEHGKLIAYGSGIFQKSNIKLSSL